MVQAQPALELLAKGEFEELHRLLDADPAAAEARDGKGVSLVMHTLYRGRRDLAEAIAARKAQLDASIACANARAPRT